MKKDSNILASVALFGELFDSRKDIYDVISEFIKATIIAHAKWTFTVTELSHLLEETFDFKIPDAVIKSALKNRLKRDKFISQENGLYVFDSSRSNDDKFLSNEFQTMKANHVRIFNELVAYVERITSMNLSEAQKNELNTHFNSYLLERATPEQYAQHISSFIIENRDTPHFTDILNTIKEGLVLYTGIRYTADLNDLGKWNHDLIVFLDTEHLFNAVGYHGLIFSQVFDDFLSLVLDINNTHKHVQKKKIELRYFEETKEEVDNFFFVAQKILEGKARLDPSKTAMLAIVDGCKSPSDIVAKKAKFYETLKTKGIHLEAKIDYYRDHTYVVEGMKILEALRSERNTANRVLSDDECIHYLKLFTKVNVLRRGINNVGFDRIGSVLVTANRAAQHLAFHPMVKGDRDTPFASDIDFVTDRFWFKLKKGFNNKGALPRSFDIITRAQIVLSSQLHSSIAKKYQELTDQVKKGTFTQEQALSAYHEFREMHKAPEDITPATIDDTLAFINEHNLETHLREKSVLIKKVQEGEEAKRELRRRKFADIRKRKRVVKSRARFLHKFAVCFAVSFLLALPYCVYLLMTLLVDKGDTPLSLIGFALTIISEIPLLILFFGNIKRWYRPKLKDYYVESVKSAYQQS